MNREELTPIRKLLRARIQLQDKAYFIYSVLCYSSYRIATPKEVEKWEHKTAYANALGDIAVAAEYIEGKSDNFVEALLYHEVVHLVLMHPILCKGRIRDLWNIAADIKSNQYVKEATHADGTKYTVPHSWPQANNWGKYELEMMMPDGTKRIMATVEDCKKKSAITIYDELYEQLRDNNQIISSGAYGSSKPEEEGDQQPGDGEGSEGEGDDQSDGSPNHDGWDDKVEGKSSREVTEELRDRIRDAYESAQRQGTLPDGLGRSIGELLESKTNWKFLLKSLVVSAMPYEYSYRLPDKRSYSTGVYLPHVEKESSDVIVAIDTSGSISKDDLTSFLSEIVAMSRQCHNLNMEVIVCDAAVHEVYPVRNGYISDIMNIEMKGGGGTSHVPVYEYCNKRRGNAKLLINFTDGFTSFPDPKDVNIETLWVLVENSIPIDRIPFGHVIRIGVG